VESKVLNFPDAMKLAQILQKYVDIMSIVDTTEYINSVLSLLSVEELTDVINLLVPSSELKNLLASDSSQELADMIVKNSPSLLVSSFSKLGFSGI
jgi:hypothetical protein